MPILLEAKQLDSSTKFEQDSFNFQPDQSLVINKVKPKSKRNIASSDIIENIKYQVGAMAEYLKDKNDNEIITLLNKTGKIDKVRFCNKETVINLLKNKNKKIRTATVEVLAKLCDLELVKTFDSLIKNDPSSSVKREATSAIGRMRDKTNIPILKKYIEDNNPEIVLQAVRGLLVFKKDEEIAELLKYILKTHENEIVKGYIESELYKNNAKDIKHPEVNKQLKGTTVCGDVLKIIKYVPDDSVHLTFTSPPYYNARDYSIYKSYKEYLHFLEKVFKQVHRITKTGRFFVLNTSPIIIPRASRSQSSKRYPIPYDIHPLLIKMGWEFIDDIIWVKPEASVKNRNAGFLQHRKPLGYKPNAITEQVMVYRKKTNKLIDWNLKQYDNTTVNNSLVETPYETSNVWSICPSFDKTHTAIFPDALCEKIVKYYSLEGDLIFDPFAGSGTIAAVALKNNRNYFLTELNVDYFKRIKERLSSKIQDQRYLNMKEFSQWMQQEK